MKSWSLERWENGQEIIYPRMSASNNAHNYVQSTYWLENANYLRLKNMEIGYTFRNKGLQRIGISSVRLYLNGNNLLTWSDLYQGKIRNFLMEKLIVNLTLLQESIIWDLMLTSKKFIYEKCSYCNSDLYNVTDYSVL